MKHTLVISIDFNPLDPRPAPWIGDLLIRLGESIKTHEVLSMLFVDNLTVINGKHPSANVSVLFPKPRADAP